MNNPVKQVGMDAETSYNKEAWEEGKLFGIKEVVEWIETKSSSHPNGKLYVFIEKEWRSKLKEWGIKCQK